MVDIAWVPDRGDLVWLTFDPQAGREQAGRRPALVLSPALYNAKTGLALMCPITTQAKAYPFEVPLPPGVPIHGVVLADHLKNLDWRQRQAAFIGRVRPEIIRAVLNRLEPLLGFG
jgi:mRNA interferase MazF